MSTPQDLFDQLAFYTLSHPGMQFLHQNAVDAFAAQHATDATKDIKIVFALIGLYLTIEAGYSGRQVQQIHMRLARRRRTWPRPALPKERGMMTVGDVLIAEPGPARDQAIRDWCTAVWQPYQPGRQLIRNLLKTELDLDLTPSP